MKSLDGIRSFLKDYDGEELHFMEICGSHTRAIAENGIPAMLSERIHLVSGPGCPVCVTPSAYIDRLIALGRDHVIVTFGDLIRVPGSQKSLAVARAEGVSVELVYSPLEVLSLAEDRPGEDFVFAAVGFETTAPVYAALMDGLLKRGLHNVRLLTAIKTMPPVIRHLMQTESGNIDGFLAPGHVSVITGSDAFLPLAECYGIPFVVSGFSGQQLLVSIYDLVRHAGRGVVKNDYPSVVSGEGNAVARGQVFRFFEPETAVWRGMGEIPDSGLVLREEYREFDAGSRDLSGDQKAEEACICDEILMGRKRPLDCPLYGKVCNPATPRGACMVSGEGSCFAFYSCRIME